MVSSWTGFPEKRSLRTLPRPPTQFFSSPPKSLKDLHMEAILNSSGAFQRLRNQADVETKMQLAVDNLMGKFAESIPEPKRQQTFEAMGRLVTPKLLIAAATKEVQLYFALYGIEIEKGKPFDGKMDVPNPLGEGSLPSQIRIDLKETDPGVEEVQLSLEQRYDPDALLSLLPAALGAIGPRLAQCRAASLRQLVGHRPVYVQYQKWLHATHFPRTDRNYGTSAAARPN